MNHEFKLKRRRLLVSENKPLQNDADDGWCGFKRSVYFGVASTNAAFQQTEQNF
jgi:hypothetical protein